MSWKQPAMDDPKRYNIFENLLQKVNQKYIALPEYEVKRNNQLLRFIDVIIAKMRSKSVLFDNLYQMKYYGGSYYDNLKVGNPSEYDLDCVLCLPKIAEPTVVASDKAGYVYVVLKNVQMLQKQTAEASKYAGIEKFLNTNNRLSTKKVKAWMEGLLMTVLKDKSGITVEIDEVKCKVKPKVSKSGPALTLKFEGDFNSKTFNVSVDLVPCFTFFEDQWPKEKYRKNPSQKKDTFFVVPKSPSDEKVEYWRLSFQEQEKELINDYAVMKPTIRLIKKIRDRYQHKIASYYIKTVFLWELSNVDKSLWNKSLSYVFIIMLRKYGEYLEKKNIPYYWNEGNNLISDLSETSTSCIANKIKNIVEEIDRICLTQPYNILNYFLIQSEFNLEAFKEEVPISKKHQKLLQLEVSSASKLLDSSFSSTSSTEENTKDVASSSTNLEMLILNLSEEQKRISNLFQTVIEKIDNLDSQVKQLREEMNVKMMEGSKERRHMSCMVNMLTDDLISNRKFDFPLFTPLKVASCEGHEVVYEPNQNSGSEL